MSPSKQPYLSAAFRGRAAPFDFAMGAVFILAAWMLGQAFIGGAAFEAAAGLGLEDLEADMNREITAGMEAQAGRLALGFLAGLVGVIAAPVGYLIYRTASVLAGRIVGWMGLALLLGAVVLLLPSFAAGSGPAAQAYQGAVLGGSAVAYGLTLFSFAGVFVGAWLVQHFVHARTLRSLLTAARAVRWSRLVWAALLTLGIYGGGSWVLSLLGIGEFRVNPERSRMLPFLLMTLLFIPIQASAEEVMFRGYFNQALARVIPSTLAVFAVTSLAFGALHLANPEIAAAKDDGTFWIAFAGYALFGFALSLTVWFDNGLEAACGVHIANNVFAATFINYENSVLPIPGLWLTESAGAAEDAMMALVFIGAVTLVLWWTRKPIDVFGEPELHPTPTDPRETFA